MATSADPYMNGNHDHILRPRAVKPMNPEVLRAQIEDGYSHTNGHTLKAENVASSSQTRSELFAHIFGIYD
jgi:hypothetical protein